jgi:hypothetical protein
MVALVMDAWWAALFREQEREGFADLAGAEAFATIPISDRLITRAIVQRLPPSAPIRELDVRAHAGDQVTVRVRLTKPAILPPVQLRLAIEQQPELPNSPVVVLGVVSQGLASLAISALKFVDVLPPGVRFDGRRFVVDLRTLLERHEAGWALSYLTDLQVGAVDGSLVVRARGVLPGRR